MNIELLRQRLARRPFRPFQIRLSDGTVLSVPHPEYVGLSPDTVFVGNPAGGGSLLDADHVIAIESGARSAGNGRRVRHG